MDYKHFDSNKVFNIYDKYLHFLIARIFTFRTIIPRLYVNGKFKLFVYKFAFEEEEEDVGGCDGGGGGGGGRLVCDLAGGAGGCNE